ncbi:hypothetical protein OG819_18800 [Streptomyces sp. NBC_01549]|uniref:hypothetical protein n=1 Tax=Streptomyces sp. NBC_01549 TaxID=2975874 RepID=UPI00225AE6D6|nr:hypothetical protein [Streptomyces sp. NBC_01549]MCX4591709.1 hypothetical protein [Streptomyces sp. NBC_01549]
MPATVMHEPLAVRFFLADGSEWTARLAGLPNQQLAEDLAQGLAANAHPHGEIKAKRTASTYAVAVRQMVKKLSEAGFTGPASELTRAVLMRYWMASSHGRERDTRRLLKGYDAVTGGLRPEVRAYLEGGQVQARPRYRPNQAYTDSEWERLEATFRGVVDDSWKRHKRILALAKTGTDPKTSGLSREEDVAWLMLRDGPLSYENGYLTYLGIESWGPGDGAYRVVRQVREDLFPTRTVQISYALLFGIYSGIVPDGINDLGLEDVDWAGDATILLSYFKGRTSRESANIPKQAVRLLERWLEYSAVLRQFAPDRFRDALWISSAPEVAERVVGPPTSGEAQRRVLRRLDLLDDAGQRFGVHRGRIRATYEERLARRGWTGRATIDPNHTPRTEGDHYVTPTTPAQLDAVESIIEDGQGDILRKALPPVVLTSEAAAEFAEGFPDEVGRLGLDTAAIAELVGGKRDVFTAACADQLAGVHGPAGQPCPARPWVCLLCPLAVFLPRHAGNLLRLKAFFARQFRQMPTEQFIRTFGPYSDRLTHQILPKLSDEAKAKGELEVADDDTDLPLRPEEATA